LFDVPQERATFNVELVSPLLSYTHVDNLLDTDQALQTWAAAEALKHKEP
jgi:hypothetical protein